MLTFFERGLHALAQRLQALQLALGLVEGLGGGTLGFAGGDQAVADRGGVEAHDEASRRELKLDIGLSGERLSMSLADLMVGLEPNVIVSLRDRLDSANEV